MDPLIFNTLTAHQAPNLRSRCRAYELQRDFFVIVVSVILAVYISVKCKVGLNQEIYGFLLSTLEELLYGCNFI
jgi:hypothetical protein